MVQKGGGEFVCDADKLKKVATDALSADGLLKGLLSTATKHLSPS